MGLSGWRYADCDDREIPPPFEVTCFFLTVFKVCDFRVCGVCDVHVLYSVGQSLYLSSWYVFMVIVEFIGRSFVDFSSCQNTWQSFVYLFSRPLDLRGGGKNILRFFFENLLTI